MGGLLIFLRRSLDIVEWVLSHLTQVLWAVAVLWIVFASARLAEYSTRRFPAQIAPTARFLTQAQPWTHVVGAGMLVLAVLAVYIPRRKAIALAWPLLRKALPQPIETLTSHVIGETEVQRELREFSEDALELRIIAEDSGFLEAGEPQHQEALRFGPNCKILLSSRHRVSDLALKALTDDGVRIRVYPSDAELLGVNLLGELKRSATGAAACLFDRASAGYRIINLSNETLVRLVMTEFDTWFERGRNALIHHVVFDVAGVAFDGNIADFYQRVEEETGIHVRTTAADYHLVDADLNLGRRDIIGALEHKTGRPIDQRHQEIIRKVWSTTWILNPKMKELAESLKRVGLTTSISSNCDRENADVYDVHGYFDAFDRTFLSCNMQLLKPSEDYFKAVLTALQAQPWQCVFIDDARANIDVAKKLGFNAIYMPRNIPSEDKYEFVIRHLERLSIRVGKEGTS